MNRLKIYPPEIPRISLNPGIINRGDINKIIQLLADLYAARGADASHTRASVATVDDFEGITRSTKSGEARFQGARRVENLATGVSTEIILVTPTNDYQLSIKGSNGATAICSGAFTGTLTADGTNRISFNDGIAKTAATNSLTITVSGGLTEMLLEHVEGQAVSEPSEYVDPSVNYGAGINGVSYFNSENINTVDASGIVAESSAAAFHVDGLYIGDAANPSNNSVLDNATMVWPSGLDNDFLVACRWTPDGATASTIFEIGNFRLHNTGTVLTLVSGSVSATFTLTPVADTEYLIYCRKSSINGLDLWLNGDKGTGDPGDVAKGNITTSANMQLGARSALTDFINGAIKNISIIEGGLTDDEIIGLDATFITDESNIILTDESDALLWE